MKLLGTEIVKLFREERAVTVGVCSVLLHVTLNFVPRELSKVRMIWLLAVTALVSTMTLDEPAAIETLPAAAEPHKAGEAEEEQFASVANVAPVMPPVGATDATTVPSGASI